MAGLIGVANSGQISSTTSEKTLMAITVGANTPVKLRRLEVDVEGLASGTSDPKVPVKIYRGASGGTLGSAITIQKTRAGASGTFQVTANLVTVEATTPGTKMFERMAHAQGGVLFIPLPEDQVLEPGVRYDIRVGAVATAQNCRAQATLEE